MNYFVEIVRGSPVGNRGAIIPFEQITQEIRDAQEKKHELYRSYYLYDAEINEYVKKNRSISAYTGKAYLGNIVLDIDKSKNSEQYTLERLRAFIERIQTDYGIPEENIQLAFSGTGFHVEFPDIFGFEPSETLNEVVRNTLIRLFPEADPIYDKTRIIRAMNTVNSKSGLFKIPLTHEEVFNKTFDEIKIFAKEPRNDFPLSGGTLPTSLRHLIERPQSRTILQGDVVVDLADASSVVTCMQQLFRRGEKTGSRHNDLLRLVSSWRRNGLPQTAALVVATTWSPTLAPEEISRLVDTVYRKGYSYSCSDPVMASLCDKRCVFYEKKNYMTEVASASKMEREFSEFIKADFTVNSINLKELWGIPHDFWILPGELVVFIGDTGLGKTALVQEIIVTTPLPTLALTLEVHQHLYFRRLIQVAHSMTKEEVIEYYRKKKNTLSNAIDHIQVITTSPKLSHLKKVIADSGSKVVVIDTLDGVIVDTLHRGSSIDKSEQLAIQLKQIAQQMNIIILGVHHIHKYAALTMNDERKSLNVHAGKGSSALEQKADKIITIEGDRDISPIRIVRSQKGRDETPFDVTLLYDTSTFQFKKKEGFHVLTGQ
jgi:archaellum biogenesis ATPase FlaH